MTRLQSDITLIGGSIFLTVVTKTDTRGCIAVMEMNGDFNYNLLIDTPGK